MSHLEAARLGRLCQLGLGVLWLLQACSTRGDGTRRPGADDTDASDYATSEAGVSISAGDGGAMGAPPRDAAGAVPYPDDGSAGQPSPACELRASKARPWRELHGGKMLGAELLGSDQVRFSLLAPRAAQVSVVGDFNAWNSQATQLVRDADGIWSTTLTLSSPVGKEYRFVVDGRSVADPYALANDGNGGNSLVAERRYAAFSDADFVRPSRESLVIYEVHLADFSRDVSSGVAAPSRGTFAGFEAKIPHLKRLGVNAVELMPVVENQSDGYSWGYNASLFFAPDSSLSSARKGEQIAELKHLVNALHEAGIAVIMDVVYNHVSGRDGVNHFWGVDPLYYFDVDGDGDVEDDKLSWGYKLASGRAGMVKLIYDNLKYWMTDYHIDGFRLDSTENMDIEAVIDVITALDEEGFCDRYFMLEEFSGAHNQRLREENARLGRTLFSSWGTGYKNRVWDAVQWKASSMTDLTNVTYYSRGDGYVRSDEVVDYVSSHDEGTLHARFGASQAQVRVAALHLLTAPGLPMLWAGDELMRVHYGNYHPGGSGQNVREENNRFDWTLATEHSDLIDYFAALIRLRIAHPALHGALDEAVGSRFAWNNQDPESALGYVRTASDGEHAFVALINYQEQAQTYQVAFPRKGAWSVLAENGKATSEAAGLRSLTVSQAVQAVTVAPYSATLLMSE